MQVVYTLQRFFFYSGHVRTRVIRPHGAHERFFCKKSAAFKRAAYPHADVNRRAGARTGVAHGADDAFDYSFGSVARLEHIDTAHILAAESLGDKRNLYIFAFGHFVMDHGGGVVAGVDARERIAHRFAETAVGVRAAHAAVHSVGDGRPGKRDVLPYIYEHYAHTRVLADRHFLFFCDTGVLNKRFQRKGAGRRTFGPRRFFQRRHTRRSRAHARFARQPADAFFYLSGVDNPHRNHAP